MTDTELNHALALAQGYAYAGVFRGKDMYHPPGVRTQVVPLPAYTEDWQVLMGALHATGAPWTVQINARHTTEAASRRIYAEAFLHTLQESPYGT